MPAIEFYGRRGWTVARRYLASECGSQVETIEMVKPLRASPETGAFS